MEKTKRKRVVISIEDKLKALKRIDAGERIKSVAKDYGVGEVTVGDWRRNKNKIEQWCPQQATSSSGRKSMKCGAYKQINEILFMWFTQQRSKGVPISGPILQEKALFISRQFPDADRFTASAGWLDRWKKRYGVRQLNVCGEKLSADVLAIVFNVFCSNKCLYVVVWYLYRFYICMLIKQINPDYPSFRLSELSAAHVT